MAVAVRAALEVVRAAEERAAVAVAMLPLMRRRRMLMRLQQRRPQLLHLRLEPVAAAVAEDVAAQPPHRMLHLPLQRKHCPRPYWHCLRSDMSGHRRARAIRSIMHIGCRSLTGANALFLRPIGVWAPGMMNRTIRTNTSTNDLKTWCTSPAPVFWA